MSSFWYHSPIRFYRSLSELTDKRNPQNAQYFGAEYPYKLEIGVIQNILIPIDLDFTLPSEMITNCKLFISNGCDRLELKSRFIFNNNRLVSVAFISSNIFCGRLEIEDSTGCVIYTSTLVEFMDSDDGDGRKFITIASKNYFNRNLYDYENGGYFVLTIPMYGLGRNKVDAEINNNRIGGNASLSLKDTYLDELETFEIDSHGDSNILNWLSVMATNHEFYINNIQKTLVEKVDYGEESMYGSITVSTKKDKDGYNIIKKDEELLSTLIPKLTSIPIDDTTFDKSTSLNSEISLHFNEIVKGNNKTIYIYENGVLKAQKTFLNTNVGKDFILNHKVDLSGSFDFIEGNYLILIPANSFINDWGFGNTETTINFIVTDLSILPTANLKWEDNTTTDKSGELLSIKMKYTDLISGGHNTSITNKELRHYLGGVLQSYLPDVSENTNYQFNLLNGENTFILSLQNNLGVSNTSNILKYTKSVSNVYVKLVERNENTINETIICNGNQFKAGYTISKDFYLEFYSDAAGTTPLDVTGLGLVVKIYEKYSDYVENVVINGETLLECSGTEILFGLISTFVYMKNCENETTARYTNEVSILNGNYTII